MIGYPGYDSLRVGARGFWRGSITVYGVEQHSASRAEPRNAISKASSLVAELNRLGESLRGERLSPQLTVTGIRGGSGFSTVPDSCVVRVDVRLTPDFDGGDAEVLVRSAIDSADIAFPYEWPSTLRRRDSWPAYELSPDQSVVVALATAAEEILGERLKQTVASPSNVGNLLACSGIPATCGFGVGFRGMHGPDEACEVASIGPVLDVYTRAVELFAAESGRRSAD